ncbi:MAG: Fic family protein [Candidatus Pacebacteria bacterium]|nr:Fic family protein [Candidatus Paceibacterota bacterium]
MRERKRGKISLTPSSIQKIHKIGFGWIFPKTGGKFRQVDVVVSGHTPSKYYLVPELMTNFCKDLQTRLKHLPTINNPDFLEQLIELLAWAQHRFLWIHPFQDYNGRIGRLLTNVILLNLDLPPVELKVGTTAGRKKYIKALQSADQGNLAGLQELVRAALAEVAQHSLKPGT